MNSDPSIAVKTFAFVCINPKEVTFSIFHQSSELYRLNTLTGTYNCCNETEAAGIATFVIIPELNNTPTHCNRIPLPDIYCEKTLIYFYIKVKDINTNEISAKR